MEGVGLQGAEKRSPSYCVFRQWGSVHGRMEQQQEERYVGRLFIWVA